VVFAITGVDFVVGLFYFSMGYVTTLSVTRLYTVSKI
jgi:hypothetical protein